MGKPYAYELAALASTYERAIAEPINSLAQALVHCAHLPLIIVGSGGSLTASHFAAWLHQQSTGHLAKAVTPLEITSAIPYVRDKAVLFLSASGRNPDILGAFKHTLIREPRQLVVLCADVESPLARSAQEFQWIDRITFDLAIGKDGFLATNSLLATMIMLVRGYGSAFLNKHNIPASLDKLLSLYQPHEYIETYLRERCESLWERDTTIVLYSMTTQAAAIDFESKCTEAALRQVQIADYRNFAHGRHHWLAKRGNSTGVLAFVTDDDREIAERTLRLLPTDIPVVNIDICEGGIQAGLVAFLTVLYMTLLAGEACGIDPGRPGVPSFGRQIYNLKFFKRSTKQAYHMTVHATQAIERKTRMTVEALQQRGELDVWMSAYTTFIQSLGRALFRAIVLDYDGTLCDRANHKTELPPPIIHELHRLLQGGIMIGIATGRGKSVRQELRQQIASRWWTQVLVGYYNGSDIGLLADEMHPDGTALPCDALKPVVAVLQSQACIQGLTKCTYRAKQITLELLPTATFEGVWDLVQHVVQTTATKGISVVRSSHSIDILAPDVTKRTVAQKISSIIGVDQEHILSIGDCGQWPGNDFALLTMPFSLSADEVSTDPATCWHIAPTGYRGTQATLAYLRALQIDGLSCYWNAQIFEREGTT